MIGATLQAGILVLCGPLLAQQARLLPVSVENSTQAPDGSQSRQRAGQIAGYVTADLGRPLARIQVTIARIGDSGTSGRRTAVTDEQGGFQFSGVPNGAYALSVRAPGYVRAGSSRESKYYRPGDFVAISMQKGGVITGAVTNNQGEPLINVPVRALRVGVAESKQTVLSASFASRLTDDRGVYRLYGLTPGVYVVCAGGGSRSYSGSNKYETDVPTYFPSSARETAEKITIVSGQEVAGVDIAHRGEKGHVVSGVAMGAHTSRFGPAVTVVLGNWSTREIVGLGSATQEDSFAFYGVPDGEYYLIARYFAADERDGAVSKPNRIKVAGGDVTGLRLALSALGSVSGVVVLEPLSKGSAGQCAQEPNALVEDAVVSLDRQTATEHPEQLWDTNNVFGVPDDKGRFAIHSIVAGRYGVSASLSNQSWFTKSVGVISDAASDPKRTPAPSPESPILDGVSVQSGAQTRLKVTIAQGAASLSGRILPNKRKALPSGLSVHLVPAEPSNGDQVLRFLESDVHDDGSFELAHIAPGKYWVFARESTDRPGDKLTPAASRWSTEGRAMLRKEGQKSKTIIELSGCQKTQGLLLTHN